LKFFTGSPWESIALGASVLAAWRARQGRDEKNVIIGVATMACFSGLELFPLLTPAALRVI